MRGFGRKPQMGGAIALFLGVLLFATAAPVTNIGIDVHRLAEGFITIGVFLLLVGTVARWYYLG